MQLNNKLSILIIGFSAVGKSSICNRYVHDVYENKYSPTIEDTYRITKTYNDKQYLIEIIDSSGHEIMHHMRHDYVENSKGIVLMYSTKLKESFVDAMEIYEYITYINNKVPIILCSNKCDKNIPDESNINELAQKFAKTTNVYFIKTSAKDNLNINELFDTIIDLSIKYTNSIVPLRIKKKKCIIL